MMAWHWLPLLGGFLGFMLLLALVAALDRRAAARHGYRPFAPPNLAFMLIPHASAGWLLWVALSPAAPAPGTPALILASLLGLLALLFIGVLISRRTTPTLAIIAVAIMTAAAPVLLFASVFQALTGTPEQE